MFSETLDSNKSSQSVTQRVSWFAALFLSTTTILRFACAALFLGRAWQHIFIGSPYRPILYSQSLMENFVLKVFGLDWTTWATSPIVEANLILTTKWIGGFLVICAVAAMTVSSRRIWAQVCLGLGALVLTTIAYAVFRDKMLRVGELFELACAVSAPIALILATRSQNGHETLLRRWICVAVAATFAGHGLYAVGFYPLPGDWVTMVMTILGVSQPTAVNILFAAGILDFIVAIGIFIPHLRMAAAVYAVIWGFLTALARIAANVTFENIHESSIFWFPETLIRFPNFLLPLVIVGFLMRAMRTTPVMHPNDFAGAQATVYPQ
jgi:hypothetical protein